MKDGSAYTSQAGQDRFLDTHIFKGMCGGTFLDIGAHDGITFSNTWFFEKVRGWKGICVEPIPEVYAMLENNRDCITVKGAIAQMPGVRKFLRISCPLIETEMLSGLVDEYDPRHLERIERELIQRRGWTEEIDVTCYDVNRLLKQYGLTVVDYVSIDTEGNELSILTSMDFESFLFRVITVENNYGDRAIQEHLVAHRYRMVRRLDPDEIYVRGDEI